jgi:uncharacterized membrane protein YgdD (TMEM256/DUF423 family)
MSKKREIRNTATIVLAGLFFLIGLVLFIGSLVGYFLSQGGEGEISPDYMGGIIVTNDLSAYSTVGFILGLLCFGIAGYFIRL